MNFKNKTVLITGASKGIGRATAIAFAENGAKVGIHYNSDVEGAEETLALLVGEGHILVQGNVGNPDEVQQFMEETLIHFKQLDILVNNAAVATVHEIAKMNYEDWQAAWRTTLDVNLVGVSNTCYWAAQQMIKQGGGRIVNVSSRGAFRGEPNMPAYGASKAGLNALSQSLAQALASHQIFVHVVAPGFVNTERIQKKFEGRRAIIDSQSPVGRIAEPEEIAHTILFLASKKSAFSTGTIIDVNGASYLRS